MAHKLMQRHQESRGMAAWDRRWQKRQMEAALQNKNKPKKERKTK